MAKEYTPTKRTFSQLSARLEIWGSRDWKQIGKNLERYFQDPEAFKRILTETNLELIGAHYGAAHWDESSREQIRTEGSQIADFVSSVGGQYIVCSGRRPTQGTVTDEMWKKTAEGLNLLANTARPKASNSPITTTGGNLSKKDWSNSRHIPIRHTWDLPLTPGTTYGRVKMQSHWSENSQTGLHIIHLADHSEDAEGNALRPQLGTGVLDLAALQNALQGFTGWLVLKKKNNAPSPEKQVAECIEVMRTMT